MAKVIFLFLIFFYGFPFSKLQENGQTGGKRRDIFVTLNNEKAIQPLGHNQILFGK